MPKHYPSRRHTTRGFFPPLTTFLHAYLSSYKGNKFHVPQVWGSYTGWDDILHGLARLAALIVGESFFFWSPPLCHT